MKELGRQTCRLENPPSIIGAACVAGKKEGEGPLGRTFDAVFEDTTMGVKSWEKAESLMQKDVLSRALEKAGLTAERLRYILAGDLLAQNIGSIFGLRETGVPLLGICGACSNMAEGLGLAAMLIDGGFAGYTAALTSSHFCSAERQFRLPLEYGGQRPPTAQWTVTGSGAAVLGSQGGGPFITHVTTGKMVDAGVKDATNMGAAMAPAAHDTIRAHFEDTCTAPEDFDLIVTGDLGILGMDIVRDLFGAEDGLTLGKQYNDCGAMIFDCEAADVHAGGSGCGCSAVVLCGHILNEMKRGTWNRVLFCGTGALFSPTSAAQGESIPAICHAVRIQNTVN